MADLTDFNYCPKCKSENVHFFSIHSDDLTYASAWIQKRFCFKCGFEWDAVYTFKEFRDTYGNEIVENCRRELTMDELKQIDRVQEAAYKAVLDILQIDGNEYQWDMEWIGELSDAIVKVICDKFGKDEQEIYPSV